MLSDRRLGLRENAAQFALLVLVNAFVGGLVRAPFVARAQQAQFIYKYANNLPDTHPMNARAREMAAAIKAETNGRFELQIFPNSQLGSDTGTFTRRIRGRPTHCCGPRPETAGHTW